MKKFTLLLLLSLFAFSLNAQNVIIDKIPDTDGSSVISTESTDDNTGVYSADDFTLTQETTLGELDIFGRESNLGLFTPGLVGFNVFIYNDSEGVPAGNPTQPGTGVVEISNIDPSNFTLTDDGEKNLNFMNIQLTTANGGQIILPAGDYWLCVFPSVTGGPTADSRWNWMGSADVNVGSEPQLIDPTNIFGGNITSWTEISGLVGDPFTNFGWQLRDEQTSTIADNTIEGFSFYPTPSTDFINLRALNNIDNVEIYNALGQNILNQSFSTNEGVLNISNLNPGFYIMKVKVSNKIASYQIIKK